MSFLVWKDASRFGLSWPAAISGCEGASPPVGGVYFVGSVFKKTKKSFWCARIEENDVLYNDPGSEYEFRKAQMVTWARIIADNYLEIIIIMPHRRGAVAPVLLV